MLVAEIMWGLMAPVAKLVLSGAVTPLLLTDCRLLGCLLYTSEAADDRRLV